MKKLATLVLLGSFLISSQIAHASEKMEFPCPKLEQNTYYYGDLINFYSGILKRDNRHLRENDRKYHWFILPDRPSRDNFILQNNITQWNTDIDSERQDGKMEISLKCIHDDDEKRFTLILNTRDFEGRDISVKKCEVKNTGSSFICEVTDTKFAPIRHKEKNCNFVDNQGIVCG